MPFETRKPTIGDIFIPFGLFVRILADGGATEDAIRQAYPQVGRRELQTLLAYAGSLPSNVEQRFHLLLHDSYWVFGQFTKAKTGTGYWSHYQLRSVRQHGGREAVKRYLNRPQAQDGFDRVRELGLLEFSIEALVLEPPWSSLFTVEEREVARSRLLAAGY